MPFSEYNGLNNLVDVDGPPPKNDGYLENDKSDKKPQTVVKFPYPKLNVPRKYISSDLIKDDQCWIQNVKPIIPDDISFPVYEASITNGCRRLS